jgi:subtilisin
MGYVRNKLLTVVAAALALAPAASAAPRDKPPAPGPVDGSYIVVYENAVANPGAETERQERARGFRARHRYRSAIKGFSAKLSPGQVRQLQADPDVAFVVPDRPVRALSAVPLAVGESVPPTGVRRIQAATATTAREAATTSVAVIDSGVDLGHPDINAVSGTNCVTPGAPAQDDNGHGTHVAGTIGARNNGSGVVGVAPDTRVHAVKVLDAAGNGSWSQVICGIDWVTANASALGIKVSNMSLGGLGTNDYKCGTTNGDALHQAICRSTSAGILHVVAAGNDGWNIGDRPPDVPSSYPEVLTVTAMTDSDGSGGGSGGAPACDTGQRDDTFASFSNYAKTAADSAHVIAAPGTCIRSTMPGGGHGVMSGTSMASPHVAGAAALCLGEAGGTGPCTGKTPAQIIEHLRADADGHTRANSAYGFAGDPLRPNAWGDYFGFLVRAAPDTTAPETTISSGPPPATANSRPTFVFGADERGSKFECRVDAGAWASCASPHTTATLADGAHTFYVRATDVAGNVDATPASRSFTVDTVAPETSIGSGPSGLTTSSRPSFAFSSSESGGGFECRVDSGDWAGCSSPHTTAALADGAHIFSVRAKDAAGNVDSSPASQTFTVDTVAPDTAITAGEEGATKNTTPTYEFSSPESGAAFECRIDGGAWTACTSPTRTQTLSDGAHTFSVRAKDAAGNADATPATRSVVVDTATTAPPRASTATPSEPPAPSTGSTEPAPSAPSDVGAAPTDTTAPSGGLTLPRQRLRTVLRRGLGVRISSAEDATWRLSLALDRRLAARLGLARKEVTVGSRSGSLGASSTTTVSVKLTRRARARLARVRSVRLTVRIELRDGAGNVHAIERKLTLRR